MTVDVFKPNVGRLGNNLYALPELNCVPLRFVAENALKYSEDLINLQVGWRPPGYEDLWAGAETKLFVFNEVWRVVYGKSLPGLPVSSTLSEAHRLLRIHPL